MIQPNNNNTSLGATFTPGLNDVICARGKTAYNHEGNKRFRDIILRRMPEYNASTTKLDKSIIVSKIINEVRQTNGGGFVREDNNGDWYDVGDSAAREKVGQGFRDLLHTKYRSSTKAKMTLKRTRQETPSIQSSVSTALSASGLSAFLPSNMESANLLTMEDSLLESMFQQANYACLQQIKDSGCGEQQAFTLNIPLSMQQCF